MARVSLIDHRPFAFTCLGIAAVLTLLVQFTRRGEGAPLFSRKLRRAEVLRFFEKLPRCLVGMEACSGAQ
ncbi:MAG: hypothetical protein WKG03_13015, partial [Telluria sp.]